MKSLAGAVGLIIVALSLASCAESGTPGARHDFADRTLIAAVSDERQDTRALEECQSVYASTTFVAAWTSNSAEVRDITSEAPGTGFKDVGGLPEDAAAVVYLCITQSTDGSPIYVARWLTETDDGIVAIFDSDGRLTKL
ncbi:hypothetical protein [Protaetiibacter mangrovi]|uniref:Lipoprotein n=1 Tax=Protaetiibacter mangrovi TaxID=2970926 RepID=A0ABT1ZGD7_9MICO|nr:hypothetical protein [Protaetiibacter mangrovi]MCS0499776.1 hypothetical protein [Protaetiibacter mangrovi]TPX03477.1 hypothetical protein FJ656_16995 [Schumannella luteola]